MTTADRTAPASPTRDASGDPAGTPRADAVLRHPLATPAGVAPWLRARERDLVTAYAAVDAAVRAARGAGTSPGVRLAAAHADLARALDDAEHGALPRLLRRPLRQLVPGSAARTTFDRLTARLVVQAEQALRVQPALDRVWERWRALHTAHAAPLPTLLARELAAAGVDATRLEHLRLAADADLLHDRLAAVTARMREWQADADTDPTWASATVAPGEPLTAAEFGALVARGRRERASRTAAANHAAVLRARLAAHATDVRRLAAHASAAPGEDARATIVRALLVTAAQLGDANAYGADDGALWSWALDATDGGRGGAWSAGDLTRLPPAPVALPATPTTRYVVPLASDEGHDTGSAGALAWITPDVPSAVRVWNADLHLGTRFAGRIALPDGAPVDSQAEHDLATLYDGTDAARSRWYRPVDDVQLVPVARHGRDWIARVVRRGAVEATRTPVWDSTDGAPGTFRLLRPAAPHADRGEPPLVAPLGEAGTPFAGATTNEVRTSFAGDGRAWLRAPASDDPHAPAALERERALFEEMVRLDQRHPDRAAALALTPLGLARLTPHGVPLPLYRRPLATGPGLGELAPAWLHDPGARGALIAAIARTLVAVHTAGAALGFVHPDAFAYTLAYAPGSTTLAPRAVLAHAPAATPLGAPFDRRWLGSGRGRESGLLLPRLRVSAAGDALRAGTTATRGTDAAAFLRCALDLLARDPLPTGPAPLAPTVAAHRDRFAAPVLAVRLAALCDEQNDAVMTRVLDRMAARGTDDGATS